VEHILARFLHANRYPLRSKTLWVHRTLRNSRRDQSTPA
jgi:hypothetical protein